MSSHPLKIAILSSSPSYRSNAPLWSLLNLNTVIHVSIQQELLALLEKQPIDFVIIEPEHVKLNFLDMIKRAQPTTLFIFLIKEPCPTTLLKIANRGHSFLYLPYHDEPDIIAHAFLKKVFPRKGLRRALEDITIEFNTNEFGGQRWKRSLIDISNYGISWLTERDDTSEAFFPGTMMRNLNIYHGKELLITGQMALIKYLVPFEPSPLCYRVGAQLLPKQDNSIVLLKEKILEDSISVTVILKQGLQKAEIRLTYPYDKTHVYHGHGDEGIGQDFPKKSFFLYGDWPDDWRAGTLVCGTFELAGWGYEFLSVVEERADYRTLRLRSPSAIKGIKRRSSPRHRLSMQSGMLVEFYTPFTDQIVRVQPLDISTMGFSIEGGEEIGPMPSGTHLISILLHGVAGRSIRFSGLVRSVCRVHKNGKNCYRWGVKIENLSNSDLFAIANAVIGDKIKL